VSEIAAPDPEEEPVAGPGAASASRFSSQDPASIVPFRSLTLEARIALRTMLWRWATHGYTSGAAPTVRPETASDISWTADKAQLLVQAKEWVADMDESAADEETFPVLVSDSNVLKVIERRRWQLPARLATSSARRLTGMAVLLAGRRRACLGEEWRSHLSGEPGRGMSGRRQEKDALGFVVAAVRCRVQDTADLAWRPVDAILRSRTLSNLTAWLPTLAAIQLVFRRDGVYGLVTDAENLIALGGVLHGAIRAGRWWRGVKPPKRKPGNAEK